MQKNMNRRFIDRNEVIKMEELERLHIEEIKVISEVPFGPYSVSDNTIEELNSALQRCVLYEWKYNGSDGVYIELIPRFTNSHIRNFTPHKVNVIHEDGMMEFASEGEARCIQKTKKVGNIGKIDISETSFGEVQGLPDEKEGCYYIVSRLIMQALPERNDLLCPNDIVRDNAGNIIGCRSLSRN